MNIKRLIILTTSILLGLVLIPLGLRILTEPPTANGIGAIAKARSGDTVNAATKRTIDVDKIDDNNPEGGCTLREAIDVANAGLGAGTAANGCTVSESGTDTPITYEINLPSYTYTLSGPAGEDDNISGDLDITANVTINGMGASSTFIDGGGIDRVLHLPLPGLDISFAISNVTVQNGRLTGISYGGGIYNNGGTVTINNSIINNNKASSGGGISNSGSVTISNSTIAFNYAGNSGGGINDGLGTVNISNSTIAFNYAGERGGGIVYHYVSISNSTIANNTTAGSGGGFMGFWGNNTLNVINSAIFDNKAHGKETYEGDGGGIKIASNNTVNIANSTIAGNLADGSGGGISSAGTVNLTNVTIANNIADDDNKDGGNGGGISIFQDSGRVNIKNTIIAGNNDRSGGGPDCFGTFVSQQFNLIGENSGCATSFPAGIPNGNNDFVGTSAIPLAPLFAGLTGDPSYYLLQLSSLAIDQIPVANCTFISSGTNPLFVNGDPVTTDQPGTTRDSTCDIGSFEVPPLGIQVLDGVTDIPDDTGSVDFGTTAVGMPITKTFTVMNIGKTTVLTLSDLAVPTGFSIASDFGITTVITGGQTTFEIQLDSMSARTFSGTLSFTNNVVDKNPFNFDISGTVDIPPEVVTISGPLTGFVQVGYTFTATVSPITTTLPLTYVWQASGQLPVTYTSGLSDTAIFTWSMPGPQTISANVVNAGYPVSATHVITTVEVFYKSFLPLMIKEDQAPISPPEYNLYLPLITNGYVYPLVDVVNLGVVDWIGYPGYVCMYGYTTGKTPSAVYSVTLAIEVTFYPYCDDPYGCPPYFETHYVKPKLYATLYNQKNPFSYCLMYTKHYYGYGGVELATAILNPPNGRVAYPLTVTSLTKEGSGLDTTVYGTVINDSSHRLTEVRVVGMAGLCSPKEADLGTTILEPGEQTSYIFNQFYCRTMSNPYSTSEEMLEISAQGVAEP